MSTRIPNTSGSLPPPAPPAQPDGRPYQYELIHASWRGYADTHAELTALLIAGYDQLAGDEERLAARLRHAADVQVPIQAQLAAEGDLAGCGEEDRAVLLAPRDTPPAVAEWRAPVPLALVTSFYAPHAARPRPQASAPGQIAWIDPSTDESLLRSLHDAGWVTLSARSEAGE